MNANRGKKISEGGCSEVLEWDDSDKILKLARANTSRDAVRREYDNHRIAWNLGLSVPQPFEHVDLDGRPGLVSERIHGETLMERFIHQALNRPASDNDSAGKDAHPDVRLTARILSEIHARSHTNLPSQREQIKHGILGAGYLHPAEKEAALTLLDRLPLKRQMCHGDPNPRNILMRDGRAVMIDWMNASLGNPEADLAEYIIMIRYAVLPSSMPQEVIDYLNSSRESMIHTFIDEYTSLTGISYDEIDPWITPVAARKLSADAISEDEKNLLVGEIRRRLSRQ
ncbi:aminoglycoside phosphotransferase family protein [Paenibacillus sp. S-38]|uniref:aminoglycoside phosphotransferase family protein n=1 Tax=Paenibacillus sp. S-38 TaxID=3416710 RepID=UPI003CFA525A